MALGILFAVGAWFHIPTHAVLSRWTVVGAGALLTTTTAVRACRSLRISFTPFSDHILPRITSSEIDNLVWVEVALNKPMNIRPGQFIRICIPSRYSNSWLQSHPFTVVTWGHDQKRGGERAMRLELVVRKRLGLTSILSQLIEEGPKSGQPCWLDGPYGSSADVSGFGSVLMLATGMGLFAMLPHLQGILDTHRSADSKLQRIRLMWEPENEGLASTKSVTYIITELLNQHKDILWDENLTKPGFFIKVFTSYEPKDFKSSRVVFDAGQLDWGNCIEEEVKAKVGSMLMLGKAILPDAWRTRLTLGKVSARPQVRDTVRGFMAGPAEDVEMVELDWQQQTTFELSTREHEVA